MGSCVVIEKSWSESVYTHLREGSQYAQKKKKKKNHPKLPISVYTFFFLEREWIVFSCA